MKSLYRSPLILDGNGIITLTASQLAKLGYPEELAASWSDFVADNGEVLPDGFNPTDPSTWPEGAAEVFDFNEPDTWYDFLFWLDQNS